MRFLLLPLLTLTLAAQSPAPEASKPAAPTIPVESPVTAVPEEAAPKAEVTQAPAPAIPAPAKPKEDQVLARIDGKLVRESEFELYLTVAYNDQQRMQIGMIEGARKQVQDQFLQYKLLEAKAKLEKMDQDKAFMQQRTFLEMDLLVHSLLNRDGKELQKKIALKDEEIKAFYDKHSDRFMSKGTFSARHILIGLKGAPRMGDKGVTEEEAKAKIAKIQEELKAGKKFDDLAKEYSDDASNKNNGGLIKDAAFGGFAKEFEEAVHKQELGQVGEPVKTSFGYHLIIVDGRTPKQPATLDAVRDRVKQQMVPERKDAATKKFIEDTKKELDFVAGPDAAKDAPKAAPVKAKTKTKKM